MSVKEPLFEVPRFEQNGGPLSSGISRLEPAHMKSLGHPKQQPLMNMVEGLAKFVIKVTINDYQSQMTFGPYSIG